MRSQGISLTLGALACATLLLGCGKQGTTTIKTDDGTVTVDQSGDTRVTMKDDKGNTITAEGDDKSLKVTDEKGETTADLGTSVSEEQLGLKFYPNSTDVADQGAVIETPEVKTVMSTRETSDKPADVAAFYKPLLKDPQATELNQGQELTTLMSGKLENGAEVSVSATQKPGEKTRIQVSVILKKSP